MPSNLVARRGYQVVVNGEKTKAMSYGRIKGKRKRLGWLDTHEGCRNDGVPSKSIA